MEFDTGVPVAISTPTPLARRDVCVRQFHTPGLFLLTRLLRGATADAKSVSTTASISTHAPLARRDGL